MVGALLAEGSGDRGKGGCSTASMANDDNNSSGGPGVRYGALELYYHLEPSIEAALVEVAVEAAVQEAAAKYGELGVCRAGGARRELATPLNASASMCSELSRRCFFQSADSVNRAPKHCWQLLACPEVMSAAVSCKRGGKLTDSCPSPHNPPLNPPACRRAGQHTPLLWGDVVPPR